MKKITSFAFTVIIMISVFSAIVYTSCTKNACSGVDCQNGGTCSGGSCLCPAGYTGSRCENLATTTVTYNNNTFTPVTLIFNNSNSYSIPAGQSLSFTGSAGDDAVANASTQGSGGFVISYSFTDVFPLSGTTVENLDVSSTFFCLEVKNISAYTVAQEEVDYQLTNQANDYVTVPNDGNTYVIGYYYAYSNSNVYLYSPSGAHSWNFLSLPLGFVQDQYITITAQ